MIGHLWTPSPFIHDVIVQIKKSECPLLCFYKVTFYSRMSKISTPKIVTWPDNTPVAPPMDPTDSSRPTASSVLVWLVPAIKEEKARRWNMAPEMYHVVDDLVLSWARDVVHGHREELKGFVENASPRVCEDLWVLLDAETRGTPCFRRGFATALLETAVEGEQEGWLIGEGYAKFTRQRYNPPHIFRCEVVPLAKVSHASSICESSSSQESS